MESEMIAERTSALDILKEQVGLHGMAVSEPVIIEGEPVGAICEDQYAKYCSITPIVPTDVSLSRVAQAEAVFKSMEEALESCGMAFTDTVRTWFYLDELLEWYDDFNRVRTGFFEKHMVFEHHVPASTGIGVGNPSGSALAAGLIAVKPKNDQAVIRTVDSLLQGSALDYKSSFSRAIEVATPDERSLYISGTASIDRDGNSVHPGDAQLQIRKTMEVVAAILESRQMTWQHVSRGIVYYPDKSHHELLLDYCSENSIPPFPLALLESTVCREELLFELEVDAVVRVAATS